MGARIDLRNKRFGNLTVLNRAGSKYGKPAWLCECDCGNKKVIAGNSLRTRLTRSCGCYRKEIIAERHAGSREDLTDRIFGRLKVLNFHNIKNYAACWKCKCECGKIVIVKANSLKKGYTTSCGCYQRELVSKMFKGRTDYSGKNNPNYKNDKTNEERMDDRSYPEYKIWRLKVLKRDNYTCQLCGVVGNKLEIHHIEDYVNNPKLRAVLSNGICLCKKCHKTFHSIYGVKINTRSQLYQFLMREDK